MGLPPIITMSQHGGDWATYCGAIYQEYLNNIVRIPFMVLGKKLSFQYRPAYDGMHFGFWHLISTGDVENERIPDLRRCECILWIRWVLENFEKDKVNFTCWMRKTDKHIVIWYRPENYVVILAKRSNYLLLKTAYHLNGRGIASATRDSGRYPDPRP